MRKWAAALSVIVVIACGAVPRQPAVAVSSTPSAGASPSPGLIPFPGPCRLAVTWGGTANEPIGGGFITFPGADFAADPAGHGTTPFGNAPSLIYSTDTRAWLPVPRQFATPDGSKYLYFTLGTGLEMLMFEIATGASSRLDNAQKLWSPIGVDNTAAYAMAEGRTGLWRFPFTGGPGVQVISGGYWVAISGSAAWGFATATVPSGAPMVLRRLDLRTGAATDFASFSAPVSIVGVDGTGLPVLASRQSGTIIALSGSGGQTQIASGFSLAAAPVGFAPEPYTIFGDSYGLWIGGTDGVYLYQSGVLGRVSNVIAIPASGCA